jgi:hypothetical protein
MIIAGVFLAENIVSYIVIFSLFGYMNLCFQKFSVYSWYI